MIADAPYGSGPLALSPRAGAGAGALGALSMIAVLAALSPLSGLRVADTLQRIGRLLPLEPVPPLWSGLGTMLVCGLILGVLYASSQQRAPGRGLIAVGLFYGFLLWAVGSLVTRWLIGGELAATVRSWPWFVADLAYGLWLAQVAAYVSRHAPREIVVPVD